MVHDYHKLESDHRLVKLQLQFMKKQFMQGAPLKANYRVRANIDGTTERNKLLEVTSRQCMLEMLAKGKITGITVAVDLNKFRAVMDEHINQHWMYHRGEQYTVCLLYTSDAADE